MSAKFQITIPTKLNKEQFYNSTTYKCISDIIKCTTHEVHLNIVFENKLGLSELYQNTLGKNPEFDYILFMHDDLEVHDHFIFDKLIKAHTVYDIVGLAGATTQNYSRNDVPMVWHLCRDKVEDSRGIVCHSIPKGFNGCSEAHINSAYFGPTPGPVAVIDGLFMSFNNHTAGKVKLFDKYFTFHHYDMAMCANAIMGGFKIGVWPIHVVHHGLGEFAHDPIWQDHAKKFKMKFWNYKIGV